MATMKFKRLAFPGLMLYVEWGDERTEINLRALLERDAQARNLSGNQGQPGFGELFGAFFGNQNKKQ